MLFEFTATVCGLQVQRRDRKGAERRKGQRVILDETRTAHNRDQDHYHSDEVQNPCLFPHLVFTVLHFPLYCLTPSFSACPLLSYPICYFLLLASPRLSTLLSTSIAPPFHPPTPISACVASFYRTACCRCGNKSCLWSKLHGGVRAASSDCATDCRL